MKASPRLWTLVAAAAVGAALLACSRTPARPPVASAPVGPRLPHDLHAEVDLACKDCHAPKETKEGQPYEPGFPTWEVCSDCHDDEIKAKLFTAAGAPLWKRSFDRLPGDVRFRHVPHAASDCALCHGDMNAKPAVRKTGQLLTKPNCMGCHQQKGASLSCQTCHEQIRKEIAPDSHRHLWRQRHGQVAHDDDAVREQYCDLCHTRPNDCESCHLVEQPRSHTTLFRTRTHGLAASVDRSSCATCHTTDFCERCHEETAPRSHRPSWIGGLSLHCAECHAPLSSSGQNCRMCHEEPQHDTAPDQPDWHVPGMNCRLCHQQFGTGPNSAPPWRHYDNGSPCQSCHH